MLRRALLTVVVVTYLTCVLYLSGLQKTESNVNSLRKSQGRSVNIRNENNEKLPKEDLPKKSAANQIEVDKSPPGASAMDLPSKDLGKVENKKHNGSNLRGRRTIENEENLEEASAENENDNSENKQIHVITADNHTKIIQYTEEKPNLRKVITFWQKLAKDQETTTEIPTTNTHTMSTHTVTTTVKTTAQTTKIPITTHKNSQTENLRKTRRVGVNKTIDEDILSAEFDYILSEYTSKEKTRLQSSTTPLTKLKPSTDDDTDIFNDLLDSPNKDSSEVHKINAHMGKYLYEFKYAKIKWPTDNTQQEKHSRKTIQRGKESQDTFVRDFNNLEQNLLNKPTTSQYSNSNEDDDEKYATDNTKVDKKSSTTPKNIELGVNNNLKPTSTPLPDMIKELAENVKNLIIQDLVTTSKPGVTTAKPTHNFAGNKNYIVIEKIMELLQKYKTESNIDLTPSTVMTLIDTPNTQRVVSRPKKNKKVPKKTTNVPDLSSSNIYRHYKRKPMKNKSEDLKSQPIISIYLPPQVGSNIAKDFKSNPITIQTNLLEIPPLGVPVSNPASIISHNIIISTVRPYIQDSFNYPNSYDMFIKNHHTSHRMKMALPSNLYEHLNHKEGECGDRKKKMKVYRMKSHDTIDDSEDEVLVPVKKYKKNPIRYENVHGFHEKFENYQQSHGEIDDLLREDCSKDDISPRDPQPVKYMKRGNDATFKKLLRSQQRVTDMLEEMLARKNEDPIVETT